MALSQQQLLRQQQMIGNGANVASGAIALYGQGANMIGEANNINTQAPGSQTDPYGRPQYNLGQFAGDVNSIKPQGATGAEVGKAALTGAAAGATFGPIGAGVGAVVGTGAALAFGQVRKNRQKRKLRIAQGNLFSAQQLYNTSMNNFNTTQSGASQYNDLLDTSGRMQNLNSYNY